MREFNHLTSAMYRAGYRAAWLSALFLPAVQMVSPSPSAAIVYYSGSNGHVAGMTVGGNPAFVAYLTFMLWPVQDLARVFAELQQADRLGRAVSFRWSTRSPDVVDKPGSFDLARSTGISNSTTSHSLMKMENPF